MPSTPAAPSLRFHGSQGFQQVVSLDNGFHRRLACGVFVPVATVKFDPLFTGALSGSARSSQVELRLSIFFSGSASFIGNGGSAWLHVRPFGPSPGFTMASADFSGGFSATLRSQLRSLAPSQISPGIAHGLPRL